MNGKAPHTIIILLLFLVGFSSFQETPKPTPRKKRSESFLGFSLMPSINSAVITYAVVKTYDGKIRSIQPITENTFVLQATGKYPSIVNPDRKNLFIENQIPHCDLLYDDVSMKYITYDCAPLKELWKLRYKYHPYQKGFTQGWSPKKHRPTNGQVVFLQKYGIHTLNDYFYGEGMWSLFRDIQDQVWITDYVAIGIKGSTDDQ